MVSSLFDFLDQAFEDEKRILEWAVLDLSQNPIAQDFPKLEAWLQNEMHGELQYMTRNLELRQKPNLMEDWAQSVVFFLWSYPQKFRKAHPNHFPKVSSYAQGADYHEEIKKWVYQLGNQCTEQGFELQIRPFTDSAPVFERAFAKEIGLGWTGKNACLIHPKHGSGFFIGGFFVNQKIHKPLQSIQDFCGKCTRCIEACPTDAIIAPGQVDARKCISYWTIEKRSPLDDSKPSLDGWLFGCDVCQEVCPWNHKHLNLDSTPHTPFEQSTEDWYNLLQEGGGFNRVFKNSALQRAGRKKILETLMSEYL